MADDNQIPVEVDQIECAPLGRAKMAVRVTGRWRARRRTQDARAFLVVNADGRRHRFPAIPESRRPRLSRHGAWTASFALPVWLEPRLREDVSLWLGNVEIPLPSLSFVEQLPDISVDEPAVESGGGAEAPDRGAGHEESEQEPQVAAEPPVPEPALEQPQEPQEPAGIAEGHRATIAALRAELQQRTAAEVQLRGVLAGTRAELDGRVVHQSALEATHGEMRRELSELLALVEQESSRRAEVESRAVVLAGEVAELEDRLTELTTSREQVADETARLRAELDRASREALHLRDELVQLRSVAEQEGAERLLLEVRSGELSEQLSGLRAELAQSEVAREAAAGEAAGLRGELDRLGAQLANARVASNADAPLSEARSLLDEARAVTARLREGGDRHD